jgi:hypothetical protein
MPEYSNGKIYTIRFHNSNEIYIGSTIQSLAARFGGHKSGNSKSVKHIIDTEYNGDWSVCYYELYENCSCNNKEELNKREGEVIRLFMNDETFNCINKNIAGRTPKECCKEYRKNHKEETKEYNKKHYEEFKEDYKIKWKQYYIDNLDYNKERVKTYRNEHKEECLERDRNRYNNNKEYFKNHYENKKEEYLKIIKCECGCEITKMNLNRHLQTKRHQASLSKVSIPQQNASEIVC